MLNDATCLHTIQNTELIKLVEYTNPSSTKSDLGNDYEHRVYDSLNSNADCYKDAIIDYNDILVKFLTLQEIVLNLYDDEE